MGNIMFGILNVIPIIHLEGQNMLLKQCHRLTGIWQKYGMLRVMMVLSGKNKGVVFNDRKKANMVVDLTVPQTY